MNELNESVLDGNDESIFSGNDEYNGGEIQHTDDYKLAAVKYYLNNNENIRNTCKIFGCHHQSLARWVSEYRGEKTVERKTRKNHNLKVSPEIEDFVLKEVENHPAVSMWELVKLIKLKFGVILTDRSINNIFLRSNITKKKLSSLTTYTPKHSIISPSNKRQLDGLIKKIDEDKDIIYVGQFSIFLNPVQKFGRSSRGKRALKKPSLFAYSHFIFSYIIIDEKIVAWNCSDSKNKSEIKKTTMKNYTELLLFNLFKRKWVSEWGKRKLFILFSKNKDIEDKISDTNSESFIDVTKVMMPRIGKILSQIKRKVNSESTNTVDELINVLSTNIKK